MHQKNITIYFLVIWFFIVNYGNAIDVEVGDGIYVFDPRHISAYYDEPITFVRIGTKTFVLTESDTPHCTKSARPDAFYAVLTDEQPRATFTPKNTGRNHFYIYANEGCDNNICTINARKDPQGPNNDNNNNNNTGNSNNQITNGAGDNIRSVVFAIIGAVTAYFIL